MERTEQHLEAVSRQSLQWAPFSFLTEEGSSASRQPNRLILTGAYWAFFLLLDVITRSFEVEPGVRAWLPTAGLSLAFLICFGLKMTPAVLLAELASALTAAAATPIWAAVALGAVSTASFAAMAYLFRPGFQLDVRLRFLSDLISFSVITAGGSLLMAVMQALILTGSGLRQWEESLNLILLIWVGNAIGLTVVAPFIMVQVLPMMERLKDRSPVVKTQPAAAKSQASRLEQIGLALFLLGVLWAVFVHQWPGTARPAHLCFLPLIWAAIRYGLAGATVATLIINLAAMLSTSLPRTALDLADTQVLMLTLSLTGLFLGAVVTQRWQALHQLSVEKAYLEQLFERAPEGIVVVDNQSRILRANAEFTRMFGYPRKECLGKSLDHLIVPQDFRDEALTVTGKIINKESVSLETVRRRKDGSLINVSILGNPVRIQGGQVAVFGIYRDVTSRRELEEQLRQAQKMEAVGRLAGGVAHDFNNLLTAILGYSELLLNGKRAPGKTACYAEEIRKAAERAKSLTTQLLAFSRKQILTPRTFPLGEVVTNIKPMLERLLSQDIELESRILSRDGNIRADRGQIEQVIVNLAVNAGDAMPNGGRITIEVSQAELDEQYSRSHSTLPGPYLCLRFSDSGSGIQPDVQKHIFEPFFTTKEQGKGTGLGLATVYGIVKQSGGHIEVRSESGQGTTFLVYFPRAAAPQQSLIPEEQESGTPVSSATILVVEDEEGLRSLISEVLQERGYQVLEAPHGSHALLMAEAFGDPIQLLLTDVVMPEMSGRDLAQRLGVQRPDVKFLFMSGYSDDHVMGSAMNTRNSSFLQKPFTPEALLKKVQEMLG